jgi:hypothetical protein
MNCRNPWINSTVLKIELVELCHGVYHDSMVIEIYITISKKKKKNCSFSLGICVGDMVNKQGSLPGQNCMSLLLKGLCLV